MATLLEGQRVYYVVGGHPTAIVTIASVKSGVSECTTQYMIVDARGNNCTIDAKNLKPLPGGQL